MIVRSAVGSTTVRVVSNASIVAPSNTTVPDCVITNDADSRLVEVTAENEIVPDSSPLTSSRRLLTRKSYLFY